jgi:hypothetical protein
MLEVLNKHVPNNVKAQFDDALRRRVCLIVNERSLNCPPMVAAPLHGALHSERAAIDDDVTLCFVISDIYTWHD